MSTVATVTAPPRPDETAPAADGSYAGPALARKRSAATMLITDPDDRVLIVNPTYKPRWELPGGAVEADESPARAAARETHEELGLALHPGRLLALDYVPAAGARTEGLITVFDGGVLADIGAVVLPADELSAAEFVAPDDLEDYLPALQARRARAALHARQESTVAELEDGHPR